MSIEKFKKVKNILYKFVHWKLHGKKAFQKMLLKRYETILAKILFEVDKIYLFLYSLKVLSHIQTDNVMDLNLQID